MGMAAGSPLLLFTRPLAATFLIAGVLLASFSLYARIRQTKVKAYIIGDGEEQK